MITAMELKATARHHLRAWPLFEEGHSVEVEPLHNGREEDGLWLGYFTTQQPIHRFETYFDANILKDGEVLFLLSIALSPAYRGQGLGSELYHIIERIAKDIGMKKVQMMPSGWTWDEKGQRTGSRKDYMLRRGYKPTGLGEVVKEL